MVGSAATALKIDVPAQRSGRSGWLHPNRQAANEPSHFEPAEEFLEELIEEDRRRARRRRVTWIVGALVALALLVGAGFVAYSWTQTRYFVGTQDGQVVVFQGVQQNIGPISLSHPYEETGIDVSDLPPFERQTIEETISAGSLAEAREIVLRLMDYAEVDG